MTDPRRGRLRRQWPVLWHKNDGATAIWFEANPAFVLYPGSTNQRFQSVLDNPF